MPSLLDLEQIINDLTKVIFPGFYSDWDLNNVSLKYYVGTYLNKSFKADFEAYCPFGGVQALGSYILNQALACTMTSAQIVMGVLMMVGVFLFSKLFCGYICPIGTFSEWLGKLGDRLKIRITFSGIVDKLLRSLKYILLLM